MTSVTTTTHPHVEDTALRSAERLLGEGRYDDAADLLRALERSREAAGDAVEAGILAAARRLCLACRHHREEMEATTQAARAAAGMERRMRERLEALLDLAATRSVTAPHPPAPAPAPDAQPAPSPAHADHDALAIQCLGGFSVLHGDRRLEPWPNRRSKAVFKYLVINRDRPVVKEVLMDVFWPEADCGAARNNLNVAVHALRRFLRDGHAAVSHVVFRDGCYAIDPELPLWVDAEEFARLADAGEHHERGGRLPEAVRDLHAAEVLYQGGLFDDDPYEEWMLERRRELQDRYVGVLERLGTLHKAADDDLGCVEIARKILAVEPFREAAHRELMRCYARQGQQHLALRQYHDCARILGDALDTRPSAETEELHALIRRGDPV